MEASDFTVGALFRQRAEAYESSVLFEIPDAGGGQSLTWELPHDRHHRDGTTNRPRAAPAGWSCAYTTTYRRLSISASRSTGGNVT